MRSLKRVNPGSIFNLFAVELESLQAKLLEARASKDELEMKALRSLLRPRLSVNSYLSGLTTVSAPASCDGRELLS